MFRLVLLLLFSIIGELVNSSSILVKDGVYSRVTVQIQDQPQPSSCVDFLDHLEVRELFIFFTSVMPSLSSQWRLLGVPLLEGHLDGRRQFSATSSPQLS